ncbi:MAG TPA: aldo/keto reductase [Elusimicrobiota bacterium]|nr:aldo/keto reductase [Elusimicrobiota bacterium]
MSVPDFIYGTAWKEGATEGLVREALNAGFAAVDTANQRRHYHEQGVGDGLRAFLRESGKRREELFLQTKFTFADGQDHRKPYDERAPYAEQVRQSFESSLKHLGVDYLDSYLLHGPAGHGLGAADWEVWGAMTELLRSGKARAIGVSNFDARQLDALVAKAEVRPAFVQNRCYASRGWDREVRALCRAKGIAYQGFSLLTANVQELTKAPVRAIAQKHGKTLPQIAFRFSQQLGIIPLTGTTDAGRMREDLDIRSFSLSEDEVRTIEEIGG